MENTLLIPGLENEHASPDFSRLRDAVLRTGRSDRLPFLELFADREIVQAILGRQWQSIADEVEFWYRLGYDSCGVSAGLYFHGPRSKAPDTAAISERDRYWVVDDVCPITDWHAMESYDWPDPELVTTENIDSAAAVLPEGMGLLLNSSGVLENVMWLMGYAGLAQAIYDAPELVQAMFDQVGGRVYRAMQRVIDHPAIGGIFFGEDMGFKTATMIAPEHLRQYHFPYLKKIFALVHDHDKFVVLHSCGNLAAIMDDLIDDVKIDAKHSYEDAIMPVAEFKKTYGKRVGVVGGIDVDALSRMEEPDLRKYVRRTLEQCVPGGGYALGSGNSVANYCKIENYLAMLDEGWRYRAR